MTTMEIILLIAGGIVFLVSFLVPAGKKTQSEDIKALAREDIKELVTQEMEQIKGHVEDVVEESMQYAVEKTERSLERLSNEKITAVSEYSDTVLEEINKNHKEVMFLYDMLNDKHKNIKSTVTEMARTVKEVEVTAKEAEAVVKEAKIEAQTVAPVWKTEAQAAAPVWKTEAQAVASVWKTEAQTAAPVWKTEAQAVAPVRNQESQPGKKMTAPATESFYALEAENVIPGSQRIIEAPEIHGNSVTNQGTKEKEITGMDISFIQDSVGLNSNDRILRLYKEGKSKVAIAKELGLGVGEVKLVIDLYKG